MKGKRIYPLIGWSILWFIWNNVLFSFGVVHICELDGADFWNPESIGISYREVCRWLMLRLPLYFSFGWHVYQFGHMRTMQLLRFGRYSGWQRKLLLDLAGYCCCWQLTLEASAFVQGQANLYEIVCILFCGIFLWCMCGMFVLLGELCRGSLGAILTYVWNFMMIVVGCRHDNIVGKFCLLMAGTADTIEAGYLCLLAPCLLYGSVICIIRLFGKKYMIEAR